MNPAVLDRVRKALESVPLICGAPRQRYTRHTWSPDYDALAAKVAPLVEALEDSKRGFLRMAIVALYTPTACKNQAAKIDEALAPWRTEGST